MIVNPNIKPGDAIFAKTNNFYGTMIRAAQATRWWQGHAKNHMAIVVKVDPNGQIWVVQMARHGELVKLEDVAPNGELWWTPMPNELDRQRAVDYAMGKVGEDYGVLTIFSIGLNLMLPDFMIFDIRREGTLICSALVARCWEHGGWNCPVDPFQITPGQFWEVIGRVGTQIQ